MTVLFLIVVLWLVPVLFGYRMYQTKDRDACVALPVLLGWIGLLVAASLPTRGQRCPYCDSIISHHASVCRYCARSLDER